MLAVAFLAVLLLGLGYGWPDPRRHAWRIGGWLAFAAYWPTEAPRFFAAGDPVNAWVTLLSPLLFLFLAFHEWRSRAWAEDPAVLKWLAGTTAIAAGTYLLVYEIPVITTALTWFVTWQSVLLLRHGFGLDAGLAPSAFDANTWDITLGAGGAYAVTVVLACTAVQTIMTFVGAIATAPGIAQRRRWAAYAVVVPAIWIGNLFRVTGITAWFRAWDLPAWFAVAWRLVGVDVGGVGSDGRFEFLHVVMGKGGSLVLLVILALWLFRRLPEVHGLVLDVFDLRRRRAPGFDEREVVPPETVGAP